MNTLDPNPILMRLGILHTMMRDHLHAHICAAARSQTLETLAESTGVHGGDTIYKLDSRGEEILLPFCEDWGR